MLPMPFINKKNGLRAVPSCHKIMNTKLRIAFGVSLLCVAAFVVDYFVRCHGSPLSREEALGRATSKLQRFAKKFVVGDALPPLVHEEYDPQRKEWTFTFENRTYAIGIIVDRCHGTDIGGVSEGCRVR
jgi:hypothetical protein